MSTQPIQKYHEQFASFIDELMFPVRFPQDYEILCECGDAMEERDHSELMRLDRDTLIVWHYQNYHCVNCGGEEDEPDINPLDALADERYAAFKERKLG